ncbi:MAG: UDP-N-acetylmuramyl-tripeptide synthetase, partial [Candidatus Komeilibacteria bacterium]
TIIGVTGTNGKSTTVVMLGKILEEAGNKVGFATTINFKVADKEWLNDQKMTMLGRFKLQKLLKDMTKANCKYAVIETSSEGIKQFRHLGIDYNVLVFTNLTPEHIESHGSFDNYKKAKLKIFKNLGKTNKNKKTIIANIDDQHAADFLSFNVTNKIGFSTKTNTSELVNKVYSAKDIAITNIGSEFKVNDQKFSLNLLGKVHIYNALAAISTAKSLGVDLEISKTALEKIKSIPGRAEFIDEGQSFKVLVDYAPEPESLKQLYTSLDNIEYNKLIHILGSCGGGRDKDRQPLLGQMAATKADTIIITNEDPYDDDPMTIINNVAKGAEKVGQITGKTIYKIVERKEAIAKALKIAKSNDLVLITGKGSEQAMCIAGGKKIPWDDRQIVREELKKL